MKKTNRFCRNDLFFASELHEIIEVLNEITDTDHITKYMANKYRMQRDVTFSLNKAHLVDKVNSVGECMRVGYSNYRYVN